MKHATRSPLPVVPGLKSVRPRRIAGTLIAALFAGLLGACSTLPEERGSPALWRVDHDGQRLWLFGTIHDLPPSERRLPRILGRHGSRMNGRLPQSAWRTPALMGALRAADELVLEINEPGDPDRIRRLTETLTGSPPSNDLARRLPPDIHRELRTAARERGVDPDALAKMDASGALFLLSMLAPRQRDQAGRSVEFWLLLAARLYDLRVDALESSRTRIASIRAGLMQLDARRRLNALIEFLRSTRRRPARGDVKGNLYRPWLSGNVAVFDAGLETYAAEYPEMYAAFFTGRVDAWMETIATMLTDRTDEFVAVGIGHLAGPDNLVERLEKRGYTVQRLQ